MLKQHPKATLGNCKGVIVIIAK